ncbi:hypothetical protein GCM10023220_01040 [Streptomyces ziwulingensis]|uniref:Uncharacterized protein n=1 Tax=Streptomyces ziwulingensis TaxID=1045501 RepID=A0ABP9AJF9_9ACTN
MLGHTGLLGLDEVSLSLVKVPKDILAGERLQDGQTHALQLFVAWGTSCPFPTVEPLPYEGFGRP